jgi:hypothetical protein
MPKGIREIPCKGEVLAWVCGFGNQQQINIFLQCLEEMTGIIVSWRGDPPSGDRSSGYLVFEGTGKEFRQWMRKGVAARVQGFIAGYNCFHVLELACRFYKQLDLKIEMPTGYLDAIAEFLPKGNIGFYPPNKNDVWIASTKKVQNEYTPTLS